MNRVFIVETKQNVVCNIYLQYLIKSKKGSRIFYDILVGVNEYIPQAKWQAEMGAIGEEEWKTDRQKTIFCIFTYYMNLNRIPTTLFTNFSQQTPPPLSLSLSLSFYTFSLLLIF